MSEGARVRQFSRDGLTFDVLDEGPVDGSPVVLLHGFPQRASSWQATTEILNRAGFRTYAVDQRGYGPRARRRGRRAHRVAELVEDVAELIEQIGKPVTLVGHDWGAIVAWSITTRKPDLVAHLVAASVPHLAAYFSSLVRSNQLLMSWYVGLFQLPLVPELLTRFGWMRGWLGRIGMSPAAITAWERDFIGEGSLRGALGWYRALPLLEPREVRVKTTRPTTFLWSDGDQMLGRKGAELTERYVTGPYRYVELNGYSHWLPDEAPEVFAELVIDGPPQR